MDETVERSSLVLIDLGIRTHGFEPWSTNVTEWDVIRSWPWQPGLSALSTIKPP